MLRRSAADPRPRRWTNLLIPLFLQLVAASAAAQTVNFAVRDAANGAPVGGAMVRVEDAAGVVVRAGFTREDGTLRLRVPAGAYQVFVRRAGFHEASAPLAVAGAQASLSIDLRGRPLMLDTVLVVAPGEGEERGRHAFLRRSQTEDGVFLDPAYLTQRYHSTYIGDLLYGVPDLKVVTPFCASQRASSRQTSIMSFRVQGVPWAPPTGCSGRLAPRTPVSTRGWGCFTILLNGRPPEMGSFDVALGHNEIDFWYRPRDVVGVEVYHVPSQIPRDLRRYSEPRCGMINYWTREKW